MALSHGDGKSHANILSGERSFAKKIPLVQNTESGFPPRFGYDGLALFFLSGYRRQR